MMKDEVQSVGKCACGFVLLRAGVSLNSRLLWALSLKGLRWL